MDLHLKGKVILIAEAAQETRAAIARACAKEGAVAVIVDGDAVAGAKLQVELRNSGAACLFIANDVSRPELCPEVIQQSVEYFGRIDALVNDIAANGRGGSGSGDSYRVVDSLTRRLTCYYSLAHHVVPHLKRSAGVIVNIASMSAASKQNGKFEAACAQGAIEALTREWAAELLPYGIRVNTIVPGKTAGAEEIAATTLFLISPESAHTTAQHITVEATA
jgi:L-fucose dehydrogenase